MPHSYHRAQTFATTVSGVPANPCGHMLLNVGGKRGWYFHVSEFWGYPRAMGYEGYRRHMTENRRTERRRLRVLLTDASKAQAELERELSEKWFWGVLPITASVSSRKSSGRAAVRRATARHRALVLKTTLWMLAGAFGAFLLTYPLMMLFRPSTKIDDGLLVMQLAGLLGGMATGLWRWRRRARIGRS